MLRMTSHNSLKPEFADAASTVYPKSMRRLRQRRTLVARHTPFKICLIVCAINCSESAQCASHYSYYLCSTCPVPPFHHFSTSPSSNQSDVSTAAHPLRAKLLRFACALHPNDLMRTEDDKVTADPILVRSISRA